MLALIVLAFSLKDAPRPLTPELAPTTFSSQRALATATQITAANPLRESGGAGDGEVAELVRARLEESGFPAAAHGFRARTLNGRRTLRNVIGVRAGPTDRRLVIVAPRDNARGMPAGAGAVETGVLLELARVLEGRSFVHTLVLVSVAGGVDGGLGAAELASRLRGPVDAVVVLRNLSAGSRRRPVLARYNSRLVPDGRYLRTVDRIARLEFGASADGPSLISRLVRMGFPMALGDQAGFPDHGLTALAISPAGEPSPTTGEPSPVAVAAAGRSALRVLTTMDDGFRPSAPAPADLELGGKRIPAWALILFAGTLMLPLVIVAVDGWARARRRRETATRGLLAPPLVLAWLLLLALALRGLGAAGAIDAPPLPVDPNALRGTMPVVVGLIFLVVAPLGMLVATASARRLSPAGGDSGFALWLAFAGIAVFAVNPVAALFFALLLHMLVLMLLAGTRPRRAQVWLTIAAGVLPLLAVPIHYLTAFEAAPLDSLRFAVSLQAGGFSGLSATVGGCLVAAAAFAAAMQLHWTATRRVRDRRRSPFIEPV